MTGTDPGPTVGQLLLTEYERLKDEQKARIGFRDNLIYVTLASMAAVVTAALTAKGHANLLLMLPPVSTVLGWTYLVNDEKVTAIGHYLRGYLAPKLDSSGTAFAWETTHRSDRCRKHRKIIQMVVELGTFAAPAAAAIIVYWINGPWEWPFLAVSIAELAVALGLVAEIVRYADVDVSGPNTSDGSAEEG
ncbi:hypothetical protein AB0M20_25835 [Actinoplanes sp. NPDC051633]|uniref:hypothetical protein n=1 Tax=Actinoplanes sp. NPDC051633 TaxID=3155670 RepID=UPI003439A6EE